MFLFYQPTLLEHPFLEESDAKHCLKVLRKRRGDQIGVLDGLGNHYVCEIVSDQLPTCQLRILSVSTKARLASRDVHLAVAPTKNPDRIEYLVEKCGEMGVASVTLVITDHSERKYQKIERLEKIAISALKQSYQPYLLAIHPPVRLVDWLPAVTGQRLIAHLTEEAISITEVPLDSSVTLLVGPEGDFSPAELMAAKHAGWTNVLLGNARLRTETAGLVGASWLTLT